MDEATAAATLANFNLLAATIKRLFLIGALSAEDVKEIAEDALLNLETAQGRSPHLQAEFETARLLIEQAVQSIH